MEIVVVIFFKLQRCDFECWLAQLLQFIDNVLDAISVVAAIVTLLMLLESCIVFSDSNASSGNKNGHLGSEKIFSFDYEIRALLGNCLRQFVAPSHELHFGHEYVGFRKFQLSS